MHELALRMPRSKNDPSHRVGQVGTTIKDINFNILAASFVVDIVLAIPVKMLSRKLAGSDKLVRGIRLHNNLRRRVIAVGMAWWRYGTNVSVLEKVVGLIQRQANAPVKDSIAVQL